MDHRYFLICEDSPVMQVVRKHEEQYKVFCKALEDLRIKYNAKEVLTYGCRSFAGLKFAGEIPKGWRTCQDGRCVPDSRCKIGKEIKKETNALPRGYDEWDLSSDLGEGYLYFDAGHVYFSGAAKYGDKYILRVPASCCVMPEGCTKLKMSEYWQIREQSGAAHQG